MSCKVPGCGDEVHGYGFCALHYSRWKRHGDPLTVLKQIERHGFSRKGNRAAEYNIWRSMKGRCHDPNSTNWDRYGGRGISVCARWKRSFSAFFSDVGARPSPQHSLERKNNNGNYEPGNVKWATPGEQNRNMRSNSLLTIDGVTNCVTDWSEVSGIRANTIFARLYQNWDEKDAVFRPLRHVGNRQPRGEKSDVQPAVHI